MHPVWPSDAPASLLISPGQLGCLHVPAAVKTAAMHVGARVSFSVLISLGYMLSSGIVGSCGSFIPRFFVFCFFLRTLHQLTFPPTGQKGSVSATPLSSSYCL